MTDTLHPSTTAVTEAMDAVIKLLVERADAMYEAGTGDPCSFMMATITMVAGKLVAAYADAEGGSSDAAIQAAIEKMISGIRLSAQLHATINALAAQAGMTEAPADAEEAA